MRLKTKMAGWLKSKDKGWIQVDDNKTNPVNYNKKENLSIKELEWECPNCELINTVEDPYCENCYTENQNYVKKQSKKTKKSFKKIAKNPQAIYDVQDEINNMYQSIKNIESQRNDFCSNLTQEQCNQFDEHLSSMKNCFNKLSNVVNQADEMQSEIQLKRN